MSTLSPRDARIQAIHEIGVKLDDALEVACLETARREGAHAAFTTAARNLAENTAAVAVCQNLASQTFALVHAARGAETQTRAMIALVKQTYDLELVKKRRETEPVVVAPEPAPTPDAPAPVAPRRRTRTIKEERLALAAQAKLATPVATAGKSQRRPRVKP